MPTETKPEEKKEEVKEEIRDGDKNFVDQMNNLDDGPEAKEEVIVDDAVDESAADKEEIARLKQQIADTPTDPVDVLTSAI